MIKTTSPKSGKPDSGFDSTNISQVADNLRLIKVMGMDANLTLKNIESTLKHINSLTRTAFKIGKTSELKSVDKALDAIVGKISRLQSISKKVDIVVNYVGADTVDKVFKDIQKVDTEYKKLKKIADTDLDLFKGVVSKLDLDSISESTKKALDKVNTDLKDKGVVIGATVTTEVDKKMDSLSSRWSNIFGNIKPPEPEEGDDKEKGMLFVREFNKSIEESNNRLKEFRKFLEKASSEDVKKAESALATPPEKEEFRKALKEKKTAEDQEKMRRVGLVENNKPKGFFEGLMFPFQKNKGVGGEGKKTLDTGKKEGPLWDVLNKLYLPQIPGASHKSVGEMAGGGAGGMAGALAFGIQGIAEILQKIFGIIVESSGFMKAVMKMLNVTIQMFFRPIGDMLGRFLMPYLRIMMVRTAKNYAKWAQGGFKLDEMGDLMMDNFTILIEGFGAILWDSLVNITFMQAKILNEVEAILLKGIIWIISTEVKMMIGAIFQSASFLISNLLNGFKWVVDTLFNVAIWIIQGVGSAINWLAGMYGEIIKSIGEPMLRLLSNLVGAIPGMADPELEVGFRDAVDGIVSGITGWVNGGVSTLVNPIKSLKTGFDSGINSLRDNIVGALNTTMGKLFSGVDAVGEILNDVVDAIKTANNDNLDTLRSYIPSALSWFAAQNSIDSIISQDTATTSANTGSGGTIDVGLQDVTNGISNLNIPINSATTAVTGTTTAVGTVNTSLGTLDTNFSGYIGNVTNGLADAGLGGGVKGSIDTMSTTLAGLLVNMNSAVGGVTSAVKGIDVGADASYATSVTVQQDAAISEYEQHIIDTVGHTYAYFRNGGGGPGFAKGGMVTGPIQALIGEGSEDEVVLPMQTGARVLARELDALLTSKERRRTDRITVNLAKDENDTKTPVINMSVAVNGPVYGVNDLEKEFNRMMTKALRDWSWR